MIMSNEEMTSHVRHMIVEVSKLSLGNRYWTMIEEQGFTNSFVVHRSKMKDISQEGGVYDEIHGVLHFREEEDAVIFKLKHNIVIEKAL